MITSEEMLASPRNVAVDVAGEPDVGVARRQAMAACRAQGFRPAQEGRVCLVATELATNLVKYARNGRILVRLVHWDDLRGVELLSVDSGPGMIDVGRHMADGFSTGGTLGGGLGAVARLSDQFDIHSAPGSGTVVMARLWAVPPSAPSDHRFLVGPVAEAMDGEAVSGDGWAVEQRGGRIAVLVADGLGHGPDAAVASGAAVAAFRHLHREPPEAIVARIHAALLRTRGAAVAVAVIDADAGSVRFCGVGNVSVRLLAPGGSNHLVSQFGIAGHRAPPVRAVDAAWTAASMLVAHSDGLSAKWDLAGCPGIEHRHPLLAAAAVMRQAARRRDDATVLAVRAADGRSGNPLAGGL